MSKIIRVAVDNREQRPLVFPAKSGDYTIETYRTTLPAGDYSIEGHGGECEGAQFGIAIERKAHHDEIAQNLGENRDRFEREMLRLAPYRVAVLVIAQPFDEIHSGRLRTRMTPKSLQGSIEGFCEKFRITGPFWFANDEEMATYVLSALRRYYERTLSPRALAGATRSTEKYPPAAIDVKKWAQLHGSVAQLQTIVAELVTAGFPTVPPIEEEKPDAETDD